MSEDNSTNPILGTDSATDDPSITGAMIILEEVMKDYGGAQPTVDHLTFEIPAGQIVMFAGPSGCGKTMTLKMINRLIEPTSSRIVINGDDITQVNGDKLHHHIGYIIQAGGLLPHTAVAENIAIIPKLLGWDKKRISEHVGELLDLVSFEPSEYRSCYPKELSEGQQRRVGVARALAVDPSVPLMDEPFGAVDPITRQRLQDELIHIQSEPHKTVVFVTHDFDEAIKLGDWIVVLSVGGQIMQYDTPDQILTNPANEFVEDFIDPGAGLRQLGLARVNAIQLEEAVRVRSGEDTREVAKRIRDAKVRHAVALDFRERPVGWVTPKQLLRIDRVKTKYSDEFPLVGAGSLLDDALDAMLVARSTEALVHGKRGRFLGLITVNIVIRAMEEIPSKNPEDTPDTPMRHNAGTSTEDADSEDADSEDESQASGSSPVAEAEAPEADATPENSGGSV